MFRRTGCYAVGFGILGLVLGGRVQAYEAYGYGPASGFGPPDMGMADPYGYAPPMGYGEPGYGPPGIRTGPREGLRIVRDADANTYYILISTSDVEPQAVQVRVEGRWILIGIDRSRQDSVQQSFDEGRGYLRSYSFSTGQTNRRLTVPQDADPQGLQREDGDKEVRITIPRRKP